MIITRLTGGLGNQMFQYAAARALALRRGTSLALDASYYCARNAASSAGNATSNVTSNLTSNVTSNAPAGNTPATTRHAALAVFQCPQPAAPRLRSWLARRQRHAGLRWLNVMPGVPRWYREPGFAFDPDVLTLPAHCYLQGYFQSPRYFDDCAAQIRQDFVFPPLTEAADIDIAARMATSCAVAVHLRHGDYVDEPRARALHGVLDIDYYQRAAAQCSATLEQPQFFVFTDAPDAVVRLGLQAPYRVVSHNRGAQSFRDMQLMSLCAHQIIANSSFSWWAAWLNGNAAKQVIAPRHWFSPAATRAAHDLLPADWCVL